MTVREHERSVKGVAYGQAIEYFHGERSTEEHLLREKGYNIIADEALLALQEAPHRRRGDPWT